MATIKVNPDKLSSGATKIEKYLADYKKTYSKLLSVIENNEAKLDATTQNALLNSCKAMKAKFDDMSSFLDKAMDVTKNVAKEFKTANESSGKKFQKISI